MPCDGSFSGGRPDWGRKRGTASEETIFRGAVERANGSAPWARRSAPLDQPGPRAAGEARPICNSSEMSSSGCRTTALHCHPTTRRHRTRRRCSRSCSDDGDYVHTNEPGDGRDRGGPHHHRGEGGCGMEARGGRRRLPSTPLEAAQKEAAIRRVKCELLVLNDK